MTKFLYFILITFSVSTVAVGQKVKIVFDVTSADPKIHESTMRHVKGMSGAYPDSQFEVVVYSGALNMVLKEQSTVKEAIEETAALDNVSFKVCAMTMKRHEKDESALIEGVGTVPDGILEIIELQQQGWGYIKEAH